MSSMNGKVRVTDPTVQAFLSFSLADFFLSLANEAQVEELESTISELEEALQQQQAEASDAVEQWSARWSELDAIKSQLETKLEAQY